MYPLDRIIIKDKVMGAKYSRNDDSDMIKIQSKQCS